MNVFLDHRCFVEVAAFLPPIPPPIEVVAAKVGAIVARHYSIRVYHRYHYCFIVLAEIVALFFFREEEVDQPLANEGTWSLARVLPSHYEYERFHFFL